MRASAPGRVNIIGEHVDYNDGFVLPFAVNLRTDVRVSPSKEGYVFVSRGYEKVEISHLQKTETWADYVIGVMIEIERMGWKIPPIMIEVSGNLPAGMGLSSSAALEVASLYAIAEFLGLSVDPLQAIEMAVRAEREFVGVRCGIMDQYTAVMGRKGFALLIDTKSIDHKYIPLNLGEHTFAVIDSGVRHELASAEYNRRREETKEALSLMGKRSYRDVEPRDLKKLSGRLYYRAKHVVEEIERTLRAAKALEEGDVTALGELLYESHESLSKFYEVSCDETDFIVGRLKESSLPGARMVGGGFGGGVLVLGKREEIEDAFIRMEKEYSSKFDAKPRLVFVESDDGVKRG